MPTPTLDEILEARSKLFEIMTYKGYNGDVIVVYGGRWFTFLVHDGDSDILIDISHLIGTIIRLDYPKYVEKGCGVYFITDGVGTIMDFLNVLVEGRYHGLSLQNINF